MVNRFWLPRFGLCIVLVAVGLTLVGCQPASVPSETDSGFDMPISLVERWSDVRLGDPTAPPDIPPAAEVRFDGDGIAGATWSVVEGIAEARVEDGRLVGRSTSKAPVLRLDLDTPVGVDDALWSAELRLSATGGTRVGVHPIREPGPPLPALVARIEEWPLSSPRIEGDGMGTFSVEVDKVFTLELPIEETSVRSLLVRPTNIADAEFAIESVRLVFHQETLASIPSGPSWQGLSEVFRETLVARSPESLGFMVDLPEQPWLHVAVGAVEQPAPTFRVTVTPADGTTETVAELAVEAANTWRPARLDLGAWAGQKVEIRLVADAEQAGTLAFWGAPTVRRGMSSTAEADLDRPRAVVVFLADTLRSDHLDAWGYERETAPTLSRLASEGVRFADTMAQATWTKASVSSILTSLYPSTTGVHDLNDRISASETTLAEVFRAAGYATFATSSVPFTGQLTNLHQGVEVLYEFGANPGGPDGYQSKTAEYWVSAYLDWLDQHRDVPTFAFIHVMDPHSPFRPREPFDTLFADTESIERFEQQAEQVRPHIKSPLLQRFLAPTRDELAIAGVDADSFVAHEKAWYDGSIRGLDAQLARLVEHLGALGLDERALLAFVSDHGEEFLDHGRHWHGQSVYGEVARVPWVLWGQGVPRGLVVAETVQNLDLLPTLLDLAGISIPERSQGRSLAPLLRGEESGRTPPAFTEHRAPSTPTEWTSFAVVDGDWKLVWNEGQPADMPEYELYRADEDPLDQQDIAGDHPETVAELADTLRRWRTWAEGQKLDDAAAQAAMSAEELEQLRALGYVD